MGVPDAELRVASRQKRAGDRDLLSSIIVAAVFLLGAAVQLVRGRIAFAVIGLVLGVVYAALTWIGYRKEKGKSDSRMRGGISPRLRDACRPAQSCHRHPAVPAVSRPGGDAAGALYIAMAAGNRRLSPRRRCMNTALRECGPGTQKRRRITEPGFPSAPMATTKPD